MSRLFSREAELSLPVRESHRTSGAFEVPIFMSPSSDELDVQHTQPRSFSSPRSRSSTHSIIDAAVPSNHVRPLTFPASSVYSESPGQEHAARFEQDQDGHTPGSPAHDLEEGRSTVSCPTSETQMVTERRRRRRKRVHESMRSRVETKKRLSLAFGITTLAAIVTCMTLVVEKRDFADRNRSHLGHNRHSTRAYVSYPLSALHSYAGWHIVA